MAASITVVAWAVDTNGNQLSAKKTVTGTIPLQPTLVNTISLTGGDWSTQNPVGQYDYINTNTNSTYYEYELSIASGNSTITSHTTGRQRSGLIQIQGQMIIPLAHQQLIQEQRVEKHLKIHRLFMYLVHS